MINALTNQETAIVSEIAGTTTDPVKKSMEIFGIGPVVLIDTAGIDDYTDLGAKRIRKTIAVISEIDLGILVITHNEWEESEESLLSDFIKMDIPFVVVYNKSDEQPITEKFKNFISNKGIEVNICSAKNRSGIPELVQTMIKRIPDSAYKSNNMMEDIVKPGEIVVLVMPQDAEAPEGRLILPQVQVIRDLLDIHAIPVALQTEELASYIKGQSPSLVITDSQVFAKVKDILPENMPLTGFSILLSRAKGNFEKSLEGTPHIEDLKDGDRILMLESCTHITSCEDIGRVKIPKMLQKYTGKKLNFDYVSALDPLPDLSAYSLSVQCGACMVTRRQIANRLKKITDFGLPLSNYGMCLAYVSGIFERVTSPFHPKSI